jgi:RNA polymerase primary sigma factor
VVESRLSAAEERALAEKSRNGDAAAQERLVTTNFGLVFGAVHGFRQSGVPLDDLVQEGMLGLTRAAHSFDPTVHTARFATYARFWIRASLLRAVAYNSSLIQVPEHWHRLRFRYRLAIEKLRNRVPRGGNGSRAEMPDIAEIATYLGVTSRRLGGAGMTEKTRILGPLLDELMSSKAAPPDQLLSIEENRARVHRALRKLNPFEAWVICERYGVPDFGGRQDSLKALRRRTDRGHAAGPAGKRAAQDAFQERTSRAGQSDHERSYPEIGSDCGLSVKRVRQIEKEGMEKLRALLTPELN